MTVTYTLRAASDPATPLAHLDTLEQLPDQLELERLTAELNPAHRGGYSVEFRVTADPDKDTVGPVVADGCFWVRDQQSHTAQMDTPC